MSDARTLVARYIRQQNEIGMPDYFFTNATALTSLLPIKQAPAALLQKVPAYANVHQIKPAVVSPSPKLQAKPQAKPETKPAFALLPVAHLHGKEVSQKATGAAAVPDPKRDALVELYNNTKGCMACGLGSLRKNYVFGSGNANAPLLVIGEAPGADEDAQGKPFVGKAGELLTKMLAAIRLDRKTHVFIANILKCRPPENRNPEPVEIVACKHILMSQIEIIKPKVILFLGRIAAHTLLDTTESIAALRTKTHAVQGISAFVTYHPAALLRNPEYKRPAWEDMQKIQRLLLETGIYADTK